MEALTLDKLIGRFKELEAENERMKGQVKRVEYVLDQYAKGVATWRSEQRELYGKDFFEKDKRGQGEAVKAYWAKRLGAEPTILLESTESKVGT